jgi:hypothetical protein
MYPALQTKPQTPVAQSADPFVTAGQAFPQLPQWLVFVCSSTQVAEQHFPLVQAVSSATSVQAVVPLEGWQVWQSFAGLAAPVAT